MKRDKAGSDAIGKRGIMDENYHLIDPCKTKHRSMEQ
jgi:hypothetical protein